MSDNRSVVRDTNRGEIVMTTAVAEAKGWLEALTEREHRGRYDTWGAARDRAAEKAGLDRSYAKRVWDRWQTMKDVSGEAYRALKLAYDAQCERNEQMTAVHRYRAEEKRNGGSFDQNSNPEARRVA